MPQKSRRARTKSRTGHKSVKRKTGERVQSASSTSAVPKVAAPEMDALSHRLELVRYEYIVPELRRIGVIAGSLLLVLVVLAFILG